MEKINNEVIKNYVDAINRIRKPMNLIKKELNESSSYELKSIKKMSNVVKEQIEKYPNEQTKIFTYVIKQIMDENGGMISTRMIEPLNINRQYLSIMKKNNEIEKLSRGIYISPNILEDSYFSFQQKYKKAIFSHMNALYFYDMTEEFPYSFTVTVPQSYHVNTVNEKCNVFYVSDDIYKMGVVEVKTPSGNKVRVYDKERCICDIIKSKGRMDPEQVKKSIREYIKSPDKDLVKLTKYSKKMKINDRVMEIIGGLYYE